MASRVSFLFDRSLLESCVLAKKAFPCQSTRNFRCSPRAHKDGSLSQSDAAGEQQTRPDTKTESLPASENSDKRSDTHRHTYTASYKPFSFRRREARKLSHSNKMDFRVTGKMAHFLKNYVYDTSERGSFAGCGSNSAVLATLPSASLHLTSDTQNHSFIFL